MKFIRASKKVKQMKLKKYSENKTDKIISVNSYQLKIEVYIISNILSK